MVVALLWLAGVQPGWAAQFELPPNRWESLVIPADPAGQTIRQLFADDLGEADFNRTWVVWTFDASIRDYRRPPNIDEPVSAGQAFWIIQLNDEPRTLTLPDLQPAPLDQSRPVCTSDAGCFRQPLETGSPKGRFHFLGSPFDTPTVLADVRVATAAGGCTNGCDLNESAAQGYTRSTGWVYDADFPDNNGYRKPGVGDTLPPWQGFWFASLTGADGLAPELVFPYAPVFSTLSGRVLPAAGELEDATLIASNGADEPVITFTNTGGDYSLALQANTEYRIEIQAEGFATQVKHITTAAADTVLPVDFTVVPVDADTVFDVSTGVDFRVPSNGASVSVLPDSFVDSEGNLFSGEIELSLASVDVADPNGLPGFPGDFIGLPTAGVSTPIISFGATEFVFQSLDDGAPVQLAPGALADIVIPIFIDLYQNGTEVLLGDEIPLWSLDTDTGQWLQEGTGTVVEVAGSPTGLGLAATVSHFSWWNCDVTMNARQVRVTVTGTEPGTALVSAQADGSLGWRPSTVDTTAGIGVPTPPLFVPSDREVCYSALVSYADGALGSSEEQCLTLASSGSAIANVTLGGPDASAVLGITSTPAAAPGSTLVVEAFPGLALSRVQLRPSSAESSVSYTLQSGSLPDGVTLLPIDATRAEIAGVPDAGAAGQNFSVTVLASNGTETATLALDIQVSDSQPPPILPVNMLANINVSFEQNTFELSQFNTGSEADTWNLSGPPLPIGMNFDAATGLIEIPYNLLFNTDPAFWSWSGTVTANNLAGSDSGALTIQVQCDSCGGIDAAD